MKIINASVSWFSLVFWALLICASSLGWVVFDLNRWVFVLLTISFVNMIGLRMLTKYEFNNQTLFVKAFFEKTVIDFDKVKSFTIKEPNFLKKLVFGLPEKTIFVKYNKFDDIILFTTNQYLIDRLEEVVNKEVCTTK